MDKEEGMLGFTEARGLIALGWHLLGRLSSADGAAPKTSDSRRRMACIDNERDYLRPPRARGSGCTNTSARTELVSGLVLRLVVDVAETVGAR
ncbi:hypothetical protein MVEN_00010000 [Mycena venus]|uniref:Uncharacterized protein n=1 Tax=Mycena venus TaxID=2733690 RepID=A0A8H6Z2S0_9AGAR|nr:hypothetical protein MVEN_00010000 [Mycena venus]